MVDSHRRIGEVSSEQADAFEGERSGGVRAGGRSCYRNTNFHFQVPREEKTGRIKQLYNCSVCIIITTDK